jgi:hypothetical protein
MVPPPPDATTDDGGSDRRRYLRYSVQCQCWLESNEATAYGPTADLALGGVFLRTAVPLAQGDQVEVALSIGRKGIAVRAQGVVTRSVRARQGRRHGVGVEFVRILYGGQRLLNFLGRAQKPAFPSPSTTRLPSPSKRP